MAEILQRLYKEYKEAVSQNSAFIAQFESVFRLVSYAIAGRFDDSTILSELLYSASNLLVLFNDAIVKRASGILPSVSTSKERLQSLVTVLEYVGVFVELAAARLFGEPGRWVAITALQIAKCVCRFLLFVRHQCGIQPVPPISPIDRESLVKQAKNKDSQQQSPETADPGMGMTGVHKPPPPPKAFTLLRSGKVMRTLSAAVPVNTRDWKVPEPAPDQSEAPKGLADSGPTHLSHDQKMGEYLYIVKPLVHLISMYACGQTSFKPWLLSSSMDVASLMLMRKGAPLKQEEKAELKRRSFMLLLYFLRSPMYDRYTKERLLSILQRVSKTVPGMSLLIAPVMDYLPVWQQIYFYSWST